MNNSTFRFKEFTVAQKDEVFKVGTDACLLGAWVNVDKAKNMLDVGTGTGVIALMLAQRNLASKITAVDLIEESANLAALNFANSPWRDRLIAFHQDFMEFKSDSHFDLLVSNPPYFKNSLKNPVHQKSLARHESEYGLKNLIENAYKMTSDAGEFSVILPVSRRAEFEEIAYKTGWIENRLCMVKPYSNSEPNRFMSQLSKLNLGFRSEMIVLYISTHRYTQSVQCLLKDFYLIF